MTDREIKFRAWNPNAKKNEEYSAWREEKKRLWREERVGYKSLSPETYEEETGKTYEEGVKPAPYIEYNIHLSPDGKPMILEGGWDYMDDDDEAIVMQYTGLKDKNGKEIYEGDIVKHRALVRGWDEEKYGLQHCIGPNHSRKVEFVHSGFEPFHWFAEAFHEDLEWKVIGNIYENPELLEDNNDQVQKQKREYMGEFYHQVDKILEVHGSDKVRNKVFDLYEEYYAEDNNE